MKEETVTITRDLAETIRLTLKTAAEIHRELNDEGAAQVLDATRTVFESQIGYRDESVPEELTREYQREYANIAVLEEKKDADKWGVWCVRSGASIVGPGQAWLKKGGKILVFDTEAEARAEARRTNEGTTSFNLHYSARQFRGSFDLVS